jgi:hypothetical protein
MDVDILLTERTQWSVQRGADQMGVAFHLSTAGDEGSGVVKLTISKLDPQTPPAVLEKLILVLQEFHRELKRGEPAS